MSSFPTDFQTLRSMIGSSPEGEVGDFYAFIKQLHIPQMSSEPNASGGTDANWEYLQDGVELIWTDKVLVQACIYTQPTEDFSAYKYQLFDDLANDASAAQVAAKFGQPDRSGQGILRPYWRYEMGDTVAYFEFDAAERLAFLTVGYPVS